MGKSKKVLFHSGSKENWNQNSLGIFFLPQKRIQWKMETIRIGSSRLVVVILVEKYSCWLRVQIEPKASGHERYIHPCWPVQKKREWPKPRAFFQSRSFIVFGSELWSPKFLFKQSAISVVFLQIPLKNGVSFLFLNIKVAWLD